MIVTWYTLMISCVWRILVTGMIKSDTWRHFFVSNYVVMPIVTNFRAFNWECYIYNLHNSQNHDHVSESIYAKCYHARK